MPPERRGRTGDLEALDHVAQWVRFADVKAAILFAALGVVLTMLTTNTSAIVAAAQHSTASAVATAVLSGLLLVLAAWTLISLVTALAPRDTVTGDGLNRFAWPTLAKSTATEIRAQSRREDLDIEAWRQAVDLSRIAEGKFTAVRRAVLGLSGLIAVGFTLVVVSNIVGSL